MPSTLRDRVLLITGAASGLGREVAVQAAAEGAIIAAVDLDAAGLASLVSEVGMERAACARADVTNRPALEAAVASLTRRLGAIDVLIANAGVGGEISAVEFSAAHLERLVRINLIGVANSIAAVLPGMLRRGRGHLVAVSSIASLRGMPYGASYCASKAGINALMDSLRVELHPLGIRCTTVCPGWVRTAIARESTLRKPGIMSVSRAARGVLAAVRRRRTFSAFPLLARVLVGFLAAAPALVSDPLCRLCFGRRRKPARGAAALARRSA
jgi:NAD(P)-dependent dehydrogenase (short-subunit alcohol dehydrogenase family)